MKATDQYFPVILFILLYKVRVSKAINSKTGKKNVQFVFEHCYKKSWRTMLIVRSPSSVTIQRKASEQYFYKVLFIILKKVVQSLVCFCKWNLDLRPFKYKLPSSTLLWCCYYAVQGGSYYGVCGWNPLGRNCSNEIDLQVLFYPYVQFIMLNMVLFYLIVRITKPLSWVA